jgi:ABC-type Zn uptake system ZnuABC Zn-binding protein ZnuA
MKKPLTILITLFLLTILPITTSVYAETDPPIIVCTTSAVGSLVHEYLGESADIVVLVQPGLCPADFDMKPSDIYAVTNARILFKQNIPGEFWLQSLLEAADNPNLTQVTIPGAYNTPLGGEDLGNVSGDRCGIQLDDQPSPDAPNLIGEGHLHAVAEALY